MHESHHIIVESRIWERGTRLCCVELHKKKKGVGGTCLKRFKIRILRPREPDVEVNAHRRRARVFRE